MQAQAWVAFALRVRVAQPLHGRDRDRAVEGALPEGQPTAHVVMQQVAVDLSLSRGTKHVARDIAAHPLVALLLEHLAAQPGATAHVKEQRRDSLRKVEHLKCALCHRALHFDHA